MTEPTPHFGFTRVGEGEDISKDGYAALDADRATLDRLLYALFTRTFNGDPALGDPSDPPTLVLLPDGGALPSGTTFYYRISYVDQYGLETAASNEASITTEDVIAPPTAPALGISTTTGAVVSGTYNYVVTQVDANGGETTVSPLATIQFNAALGTAIDLTLPDLDPGAEKFRIYRSRPGQTSLYFVADFEPAGGDSTWTDIGLAEDQTVLAPSINTTSTSNAVQITVPGAFIPEQANAWRVYRATASGDYTGSSLVHEVVEPATSDSPIPTTVFVDHGGDLLTGVPRETTATAPQGPQLDLNDITGSLPLSAVPRGVRCLSTYAAGSLGAGQVLNITESPAAVVPVRMSAYFKTAPTNQTIRISDGTNHVDLLCTTAAHRGGDAAGFWREEFPLLLAAQFQAELGTRSDLTVLIDPEVAASNGQAVTLDAQNQYVQVDLGQLDPGNYATFAKLRVLDFDTVTTPTNDLVVSVIRTDTDAVVATSSFTLTSTTPTDPSATPADFIYRELTGPTFTAPGGVDLVIRVAKAGTMNQSYDVDFMRYTATVVSLAAGPITVTALNADGADVNVSLWF